tara:strand:+ start:456 stop:1274 length:819 start_codon:yes stop_codon:yes gene_type:complete
MRSSYIQEYIPCTWFHPKGVLKVLSRYEDRLPNMSGCLFATFTIDRNRFRENGQGPGEAFDVTRDRIRKMFFKLRKGLVWQGKAYAIKSPYCTKLEFHDDEEGWPHFHVVWLTRRFVPAELLEHLWGHGRTNVKRISNNGFDYLLKYVSKSGQAPDWVKERTQLRVFQPSRGFLKPIVDTGAKPKRKKKEKNQRIPTTIGERLDKWAHTAVFVTPTSNGNQFMELPLSENYRDIFDHLVHAAALDGRYQIGGKIIINTRKDFLSWINPKPNP